MALPRKKNGAGLAPRVDGENREMEALPDREFIFAGLRNHGAHTASSMI
jgi:hypothetical protein